MKVRDGRIRRKSFVIVVVLSILVLSVGCLVLGYRLFTFIGRSSTHSGCIPPVEFSEADLIGTWVSELPGQKDTLILREDDRYKQILEIDHPPFDYESEWLPWWVEYKESGIPYLHLEGMRLCVYFSGIDCEQVGGGEHNWNDFCQDEWVQTPGEGVLMVLGVPEQFIQPPRGMELVALGKHLEGVTYYQLREQ
jgi:hypothetical protein